MATYRLVVNIGYATQPLQNGRNSK